MLYAKKIGSDEAKTAMRVIISDEHCGGHAEAIFQALQRLGYIKLLSLELKSFDAVGLREGTSDEMVWRFCQEHGYLL